MAQKRRMLVACLTMTVLLALTVAYLLYWISARHEYLRVHGHKRTPDGTCAAPWFLQAFGEAGVRNIAVFTDEEYYVAGGLFPEAAIAIP
jgi:hypothetical protein